MNGLSQLLVSVGAAVCVFVCVSALLALLWKRRGHRRRERHVASALALFKIQREQLEAKFFDLACMSGRPRGLRWQDCDWQHGTAFAWDLESGLLTAFVAVNIRFEAIAGEDMEEVTAVSTLRDATAVFHYQRGRWGTGGKALFNMNPTDAVARLGPQCEPVSVEHDSVPGANQ